jgi:hypothetical protein
VIQQVQIAGAPRVLWHLGEGSGVEALDNR